MPLTNQYPTVLSALKDAMPEHVVVMNFWLNVLMNMPESASEMMPTRIISEYLALMTDVIEMLGLEAEYDRIINELKFNQELRKQEHRAN